MLGEVRWWAGPRSYQCRWLLWAQRGDEQTRARTRCRGGAPPARCAHLADWRRRRRRRCYCCRRRHSCCLVPLPCAREEPPPLPSPLVHRLHPCQVEAAILFVAASVLRGEGFTYTLPNRSKGNQLYVPGACQRRLGLHGLPSWRGGAGRQLGARAGSGTVGWLGSSRHALHLLHPHLALTFFGLHPTHPPTHQPELDRIVLKDSTSHRAFANTATCRKVRRRPHAGAVAHCVLGRPPLAVPPGRRRCCRWGCEPWPQPATTRACANFACRLPPPCPPPTPTRQAGGDHRAHPAAVLAQRHCA